MNQTFVITAAGGNGTAIRILEQALSRAEYAAKGRVLGKYGETFGAEQAGFLVVSENHFEMAGGEFCGNAARSAALLFSRILNERRVSFTMSGYSGMVRATVEESGATDSFVECVFAGLPTTQSDITLSNGQQVSIVDLGGIVHIIIEAPFPPDSSDYESTHRFIVQELGFEERGAVGVVWLERIEGKVRIYPVVWVKEVDTFFFEQSCGSGSIAASKVTRTSLITQPTGKDIEVEITPEEVILRSSMEVVHEES